MEEKLKIMKIKYPSEKKSNKPFHKDSKKWASRPIIIPEEENKPKIPIKIKEAYEESEYNTFEEAFKMFLKGKYVARQEWKDYYFCKLREDGRIILSDPKRYSYRVWIPILEDFIINDWIVIDK